jgi:hypothetical protein
LHKIICVFIKEKCMGDPTASSQAAKEEKSGSDVAQEDDIEDLPTVPLAVPEAARTEAQIKIERDFTPTPKKRAVPPASDVEDLPTRPMAAISVNSASPPAFPASRMPQLSIPFPLVPAAQQSVYPQSQPGYPLPQLNGFGQVYPQQKKNRAFLWIWLAVALFLVAIGGIGGLVYLNRPTPEKTLQSFCTALQDNNSQGIYSTYSNALQQQVNLNTISAAFQEINLFSGGIASCTYGNVIANNDSATATMIVASRSGGITNGTVVLVYENSQWKINTVNWR